MIVSSSRRLYGRRKGRPLRVRKSYLVQEFLPQLSICLPEKGNLNPRTLFVSAPTSIWLEIGFGGGEHLATQAKQNPTIGFLGCEPFLNGVASLLDHIDREKLSNIRIFPDDARILLDALPEASVDRCFVLFADPWPKARHTARRFIGPENLLRLSHILREGSELRLATDDVQLADWMRECLRRSPSFKLLGDAPYPPVDWVSTRYEQKAIEAGRVPAYMAFQRS